MRIDILTLFPEMFAGVFGESIVKRARQKGKVEICVHSIRKWTYDRHRTADDKPYGGGPGMILKVEPIDRAITALKKNAERKDLGPSLVVLMTPQGSKFSQVTAKLMSISEHLILVCGHYEGVDERIRSLVDKEISIGDYVLTCGELPAMVICDAVVRLIPGVLGDPESLVNESFENGMLEYPQYTRPSEYKEMKVPNVLLSGDHKRILKWNREQAIVRTRTRRPDIIG